MGPLFIGVASSCLATALVFIFSKSPVLKSIAFFLAANYTGKLVYIINFPENTYLEVLGKEGAELSVIVYDKYLLVAVAFIPFAIASLFVEKIFGVFFRQRSENLVATKVSGFVAVAIVCYALLTLRAFLLHYMKIGAPGVVAAQLGIPYLTGILIFLASKVALLFVSGLVALALSKRSYGALAFALFTAALYVVIDVAGGWRGPLFRMPFCVMWLYIAIDSSKFKTRLRPLLLTMILLPPLIFVPVLQYRHMLRKGLEPMEAARQAFALENVNADDFIADIGKILNRIIGLDMYVIASHATEDRPLGIGRVLDPSIGNYFTNEIMGVPEEAVTAYSSSYWGFWAMIVGDTWLWTGGLMLGIAVSLLSEFFVNRSKVTFVRTVIGCNVTVYFINFLMANGAILLYAKEALMLLCACLVFSWFCRRTEQFDVSYVQHPWPIQPVG